MIIETSSYKEYVKTDERYVTLKRNIAIDNCLIVTALTISIAFALFTSTYFVPFQYIPQPLQATILCLQETNFWGIKGILMATAITTAATLALVIFKNSNVAKLKERKQTLDLCCVVRRQTEDSKNPLILRDGSRSLLITAKEYYIHKSLINNFRTALQRYLKACEFLELDNI